jgi:hypothetical protein
MVATVMPRVWEHVIPAGERLVGNQKAFALVPLGDQFKQNAGFRLVLSRVRQVVENDEIETIARRGSNQYRRRAVMVGIAPHFCDALKLLNVAWARAHGVTTFLFGDDKVRDCFGRCGALGRVAYVFWSVVSLPAS